MLQPTDDPLARFGTIVNDEDPMALATSPTAEDDAVRPGIGSRFLNAGLAFLRGYAVPTSAGILEGLAIQSRKMDEVFGVGRSNLGVAGEFISAAASLNPLNPTIFAPNPSEQTRLAGGEVEDASEYTLYQAGQAIRNFAEQHFGGNEKLKNDFLSTVLPEALGTGAAALTIGLVTKSPTITSAIMAPALAAQEYGAAIESGATDDDAFKTYVMNLGIGATEAVPVNRLISRLDQGTGGYLKRIIVQASLEGAEEAVQEFVQTVATNAAAILTYDDDRDLFSGSVAGAGTGASAGAILGGVTQALLGRRIGRIQADLDTINDFRGRQFEEVSGQKKGNKITLYRGRGANLGKNEDLGGIYTATDPELARLYAGEAGIDTIEANLEKTFDATNPENAGRLQNILFPTMSEEQARESASNQLNPFAKIHPKQKEWLLDQGYDSILINEVTAGGAGRKAYVILDESKISTIASGESIEDIRRRNLNLGIEGPSTSQEPGAVRTETPDGQTQEIGSVPLQKGTPIPATPTRQELRNAGTEEDLKRFEEQISSYDPLADVDVLTNFGVSKAAIGKMRQALGFDNLDQPTKRAWSQAFYNAVTNRLHIHAEQFAASVNRLPVPITDAEVAGLLLRKAELSVNYESYAAEAEALRGQGKRVEAYEALERRDAVAENLNVIDEALDKSGTETGRALAIRRAAINAFQYDSFNLTKEASLRKGGRLTQEEEQNLTTRAAQIAAKAEEVRQMEENQQELYRQEKMKEAIAALEAEKQRAGTSEAIEEELQRIKAEARKIGLRLNDITGITGQGLVLLSKYARVLAKKGLNIREIVASIQSNMPNLTEVDIYEAILATNSKAKKRVKKEAEINLDKARAQARAFLRLERALEGKFDPTKQQTPNPLREDMNKANRLVQRLRRQANKGQLDEQRRQETNAKIDELAAQLGLGDSPQGADLEAARRNLADLRLASKDLKTIEELDAIIASGIAPATKPKATPAPSDVPLRNLTRSEVKRLRKEVAKMRAAANRPARDAEALRRTVEKIDELSAILGTDTVAPSDLKRAREVLSDLKTLQTVEEEIASLKTQIETGDFTDYLTKQETERQRREARQARRLPQLERARAELTILRKETKQIVEEMQPFRVRDFKSMGFSTPQAIRKAMRAQFIPYVQLPRAIMASSDMSYVLRQGLLLSAVRPGMAMGAAAEAVGAYFNKLHAETIYNRMMADPRMLTARKFGLYIAPVNELITSKQEELFASRVAQRMPIMKHFVKAGERHMATGLNLLRFGAFTEFLARNPGASDEALKAYADYVNVASGRGNLNPGLAAGLSTAMFAPRFAFSRFQTPHRLLKYWNIPEVRKAMAKDMVGLVGEGLLFLTLASLAGATVGLDPRDSDFGKIIIGNTRIDIWGGFLQPASLVARLAIEGAPNKLKTKAGLAAEYGGEDGLRDLLARFAFYKMSPAVNIPIDLIQGENVVGDDALGNFPFTEGLPDEVESRVNLALENLAPLFITETIQAWRDEGIGAGAMTLPATFFGLGAGTYDDPYRRAGLQAILRRAGYQLRPPEWPREIQRDKDFVKELNETFDSNMAARLMQERGYLESIENRRQLKQALQLLAAEERQYMRMDYGF